MSAESGEVVDCFYTCTFGSFLKSYTIFFLILGIVVFDAFDRELVVRFLGRRMEAIRASVGFCLSS